MKNKLEYSSLLDNINEVNISTANNVAGQIAAKVKERRPEHQMMSRFLSCIQSVIILMIVIRLMRWS